MIEGLGKSFCILGGDVCAIFGAIFGVIRGIIHIIRNIVDWVRDTIDGIKELLTGILTLNWCKIQRGLGSVTINVFRGVTVSTNIPGSLFYSGPADQITKNNINGIISNAIQKAFRDNAERSERSKKSVRLGGSPIGLPVRIDARRVAIRSSEFLRQLHRDGIINLHAIAGRVSDCEGKLIYYQFDGEVVYAGTTTTVSQSDLDTFISEGTEAVASFTVYPIKRELYRRYLEIARRKGFQIGLNFTWEVIKEIFIDDRQFVPLNDGVSREGDAQGKLLQLMGRTGTGDDLSTIPVIAIFGYKDTELH